MASLPEKPITCPLFISVLLHVVLVAIVALTIRTQILNEKDAVVADLLDLPTPSIRLSKKLVAERSQPRVTLMPSLKPISYSRVHTSAPTQAVEIALPSLAPIQRDIDLSTKLPEMIVTPVTTEAEIPARPRNLVLSAPTGSPQQVETDEGLLTGRFRMLNRAKSPSNSITSMVESTDAIDLADLSAPIMLPENMLGAVLTGRGAEIQGHIRLIRLRHSLSDWWQDPTALPSFMKWLAEHTRLRADMKFGGGALPITDPRILDAPIIFMTGHDKDIVVGRNLAKAGPLTDAFTPDERAALRKYIVKRGGMLLFDDCGFNGLFAQQVAQELDKIFPEYPLEDISHSHELYTIYYQLFIPPTGGDIFWGSENYPRMSQFRHQKGIVIDKRLAVVYNRKDYFCAMETAEIESRTMLRKRRSTDVHRFMTNLLIYAMKYGGNTDRSAYQP